MFKRRITEDEARQKLDDAAMRRVLYVLLWDRTHRDGLPCPMLGDEQVQAELRRLLK